ncbi:LysR family transcriptional regulator [Adlercreutzia equolifaciens]|uniref:LysR family transcriptional regulator n=1 Tax=Adlercreutzia equolifaciens TaxID=446660 RepID=UPI0023B1ED33|nr:LysR family transcriptional regulator [Adlercreutzia equolifaciens]MDE8702687.1 LysR family transcriptional regulator [Adlercreutzia equolifaciens]
MEIRLLQSFLAIAEEGSITRAAELLHITQPALSRQLVTLENELGCALFRRGKKRMELTDEGLLLQRRAVEIVSLVSLTEEELAGHGAELDGHISIGSGELASTSLVVDLAAAFAEEHSLVTFDLFTGIADQVTGRLDRGLLDFGLLLEPVDVARYEYLPIDIPERWVAAMAPDDPLAAQASVRPTDLEGRVLSLPYRAGVKSLIGNWLGESLEKVTPRFTVNLGGSAAPLVEGGHVVLLCVEGSVAHWDPTRFAVVPLEPAVESSTVLAWKRGLRHTAAVQAFVEFATERLRSVG